MSRIIITLEVDEDPLRVDPHDLALDLIEINQAEYDANNTPWSFRLVSAEWEES